MKPHSKKKSLPTAQRATVVILGSANMDLVVEVPNLPKPGETVTGSGFKAVPGGKGANQAVAIARLGAKAILIGRVGDDAFGAELRRGLESEGVDTSHLRSVASTPSGVAVIAVEKSGQNCIAVVPGANAKLRPADVRALEKVIAGADALLLQLEVPMRTVEAAVRIAARHGVFTVLDAAPVPPDGLPRTLQGIDLLTPNQSEAAALTGLNCDTPENAMLAADALIERHNPSVVVIKLGPAGALAHAGGEYSHFSPAFRVKVVDTTAAGDAFTGALTLRLAEGADLGTSLRFANAAGALAATRAGAQNSMPRRDEVERLLRRTKAS